MKKILFISLFLLPFLVYAEAIDLTLENLNGEKESLADYRGKIVVLNFWATWCVPCRKEMPLFVELQNQYAARGVQWIAISTDPPESRKEVDTFVKEYKLNFPVWVGGTPELQSSLKLATGLPATLIMDADGKPCFRIIGESTRGILIDRLEYLLSKNGGASPAELVLPPGLTPEHFHEHEVGEHSEEDHEEEMAEGGSAVPS
jgi:thiol-disulfide isomerase/thioredoxin